MQKKPAEAAPDPQTQRLLESFSSDPGDARVFATLEESLYLAGAWSQLAGVYECRLSALDEQAVERAEVLMRLGSLLGERLGAPRAAMRRYNELLHIQPKHAQGLACLRRAYAAQGEIASALQIAEIEEQLEQPARERARALAEIGDLWRRLEDSDEAEQRLRSALELDPSCDAARAGLAVLAEATGDRVAAASFHEQRLHLLRGASRIDAMEQLAALLPADDERTRDLLRQVLRDRPDRLHALRRLITLERAADELESAERLSQQLWQRLPEQADRARFAIEAATSALEVDGDMEAVQFWLEAAGEIAGDDPRVHELRARLFRRTGQPAGLIHALEALNRIEGPSSIRELEIAVLYERDGRPERTIDVMHSLLEREPRDRDGLALLDRSLARAGRDGERHDVLERRVSLAEDDEEYAELSIELGDLCRDHLDDPGAAEELYSRALARVGEHAGAAARLAELYEKLERYDDLDRFLEGAARLAAPGAARSRELCELGRVRLELRGEPEGARAAFVAALEAEPGCAPALEGLGRLGPARTEAPPPAEPAGGGELVVRAEPVESAGPEPEPRPERAAEAETPEPPEARGPTDHLRGLIAAARESGDLGRAQLAAERWADRAASVEAYDALAEITRQRGDARGESAALEALEALLAGKPQRRLLCLARLGELALARSEPDALERSAHWLREALALGPKPQIRMQLIELCQRSGDLRELADLLHAQLADRGPDDEPTALRIRLARTLTELGDATGATEVLLPAFELDPGAGEVADLLETLLAEGNRLEDLCAVLARRLEREREPGRRRELAHRLGNVLLDGLERPGDAVAALRELADPSRHAPLEQLFERALESAGTAQEHETWLVMREGHVEGQARIDLLLGLASLQQEAARVSDAIETLQRAERVVPPGQLEVVGRPLLHLLRQYGEPAARLELLEHLANDSSDPHARTAFRIEHARILIDELGRTEEGLVYLESLEDPESLAAPELRQLCGLLARAGAAASQVRVLELLARSTDDPVERTHSVRELANLLASGPEEVRDPERATALVGEMLDEDPDSPIACGELMRLLEESGEVPRLAAMLRSRLQRSDLTAEARASLALRLSELLGRTGEPDEAIGALRAAREQGADSEAVDEALFRLLEQLGNAAASAALCREKTERARGSTLECWLRRLLHALAQTRAPAEARLPVVEQLLEQLPGDAELTDLRVRLLRTLERHEALARALEALMGDTPPSQGRRRLIVRELLRLYEGPLRAPERALALIERELGREPSLRARGIWIAGRLADAEREASLLEPLVREGAASASHERQLGLVLARLDRRGEAEPLLWRALDSSPRDREVLAALEEIVRGQDDPARLLCLLEAHFPIETAERRAELAQEGVRLADRAHDPEAALRWLRRWHAVDGLPRSVVERWVEMERGLGDRAGLFTALHVLRGLSDEDEARARIIAQEAALHVAGGQLKLARESYEEALRLSAQPPCEWLAALDRTLAAQGRVVRRSGVLRDLTRHPELSPAERERYREIRADLLAAHPDMRAEAVVELECLLAEREGASIDSRLPRMRKLLALYEELDRTADWCRLAEELLPCLEERERSRLERALAQRRTANGFAREAAVAGWEGILESRPDDREALAALSSLLDYPGVEARRAAVLEHLARAENPQRAESWLAAAALRWNTLRDARSTVTDVDAALVLDAESEAAHALRVEVCAQLGRSEEEVASLRTLLERRPDGDKAALRWLRLATLLVRDPERCADAGEAAERALETASEPAELRPRARAILEQVGAWERACELVRDEIEAAEEPDERASLLARLARWEWDQLAHAEVACEVLDQLEHEAELEAEDYDRWADALADLEHWPESLAKRREALSRYGDAVGAREWLELARSAVERGDDVELGRSACDQALERDAGLVEALELRAELWAREHAFAQQLDDLVAIGERHPDDSTAAAATTRAAELAGEKLGDGAHAWALYRAALKREPGHRPALLGAGRIALERQEWSEAERMFSMALALLCEDPEASELGEVARLAAEAALAQHHEAEAFEYLERSLAVDAHDPTSLDAMAQLSLRLGAHERARTCLETRLAGDGLDDEERADHLFRLSQACDGAGDCEAAAEALESVIALRPDDEVARARIVELLEKLGQSERAVSQLDGWIEQAASAERLPLALRAARLERESSRCSDARRRLESLVASGDTSHELWLELGALAFEDGGAEDALDLSERALSATRTPQERAPLLWLRTRALRQLERTSEAARSALETLEAELGNVEAAQLLAQNLGRVGDWRAAVTQLERFLDATHPPAPIESELWEALGRAYSGPLESIERAERCYRRALDANPQRASSREALADITAFDPAAHRDSAALHRDLLDAFPARPGSWRAIAHIAEHRGRERAHATCLLVLEALRAGGEIQPDADGLRPLIHTGAPEDGAVRAASELLAALNDTNQLPDVAAGGTDLTEVPIPLRMQLAELAGPGWELDDESLRDLWRRPPSDALLSGEGLPRRRRRDLQRALKEPFATQLRSLDVSVWREALLAQAAARAVDQGTLSLGDALRTLLAIWPETAELELAGGGDIAEALQLCAPARALLHRVADTTLGALGLES